MLVYIAHNSFMPNIIPKKDLKTRYLDENINIKKISLNVLLNSNYNINNYGHWLKAKYWDILKTLDHNMKIFHKQLH